MAYDNAQLVIDVLSELLQVGSGQAVSAEDSEKVLSRLDGIIASLSTRNIIPLVSDAIDEDAYDPFVKYVAEIVAPAFGRPTDPAAKMAAENELRVVYRSPRGMGATLRVDDALTYRNRRWSIANG